MARDDRENEPPQQQTHDRGVLLETDPRFPSGPWVGFWIQRGLGRRKFIEQRRPFEPLRSAAVGHAAQISDVRLLFVVLGAEFGDGGEELLDLLAEEFVVGPQGGEFGHHVGRVRHAVEDERAAGMIPSNMRFC